MLPDTSYPIRAGHELSGEVVEIGPDVASIRVGQRVGIEPLHLLGCQRCRECRRGAYHICRQRGVRDGQVRQSSGFSEFDVAPVENVYPLPDSVSLDEAAILDVYGVAVHGVQRTRLRGIDRVAVVGAGAVGLTQGQVARAFGARQVILVGRRAQPLELAQACGAADAVVDTSRTDPRAAVLELTDGAGADVVFETSGDAEAIQLCCELAGHGGRVGISGLYSAPAVIDTMRAMRKELDVCWINSYSTWDGLREYAVSLELLASGRVRAAPLISHHVPLDRITDGLALAADKAASGATKVIVVP